MTRHTHTQLIAYAADDNAIIFWLHGRSQLLIRASPGAAANTSAAIFHLTPRNCDDEDYIMVQKALFPGCVLFCA
jgi:hypothetical protein